MRSLLFPLLALGLAACTPPVSRANEATPLIGVSVAPQAWLIERLAGPAVRVMVVVPPAASPETYQPTDLQVSRLMSALAFFRIGMPFEQGPWLAALADSGRLEIVDQRVGLDLLPLDSGHPAHTGTAGDGDDSDPHIWLTPRLLIDQARTAAAELARLDPPNASLYDQRLRSLEAELTTLDADLRSALAPLAGTSFFVFHPSWSYFARDYGLRQVAIELSGKDPTDAELTALARLARQAGARVIFVEPQSSGRAAEAVAEAVGARIETLDPLAFDVAATLRHTADALLAARPEIRSP
jgi:zinc transport system substrate-binding protein